MEHDPTSRHRIARNHGSHFVASQPLRQRRTATSRRSLHYGRFCSAPEVPSQPFITIRGRRASGREGRGQSRAAGSAARY